MLRVLVLLVSFVTVSCNTPVPQTGITADNNRVKVDQDRGDVLSRAQIQSKRLNQKRCEGDDDCEDICKDIYKSRNNKDDCEQLSVDQVENLEALHDLLEKPDLEDLQEFKNIADTLDLYINIDIDPLNDAANDWKKKEAEDILEWIAGDSSIAKIFAKEDEDYEVLSEILEKVGDSSAAKEVEYGAGLQENLDEGTFFEVAIDEKNEEALEWIHDFIEEKGITVSTYKCLADDLETIACLHAYCAIAKNLDDEYGEDLFDFEYFEKYLDEIVDNDINGKKAPSRDESSLWDTDEFEEIGDLSNKWWENLCPSV